MLAFSSFHILLKSGFILQSYEVFSRYVRQLDYPVHCCICAVQVLRIVFQCFVDCRNRTGQWRSQVGHRFSGFDADQRIGRFDCARFRKIDEADFAQIVLAFFG